jgi:hypothetical protein
LKVEGLKSKGRGRSASLRCAEQERRRKRLSATLTINVNTKGTLSQHVFTIHIFRTGRVFRTLAFETSVAGSVRIGIIKFARRGSQGTIFTEVMTRDQRDYSGNDRNGGGGVHYPMLGAASTSGHPGKADRGIVPDDAVRFQRRRGLLVHVRSSVTQLALDPGQRDHAGVVLGDSCAKAAISLEPNVKGDPAAPPAR